MKKIASFTINHDILTPGMYVSRVDGDVITYDLRLQVSEQSRGLSGAGCTAHAGAPDCDVCRVPPRLSDEVIILWARWGVGRVFISCCGTA